MARYIDADKIHQFVEDNFKGDVPYEWAWTLTAIDKEPTADVVPVVRCKDCKFYEPYKKPVEDFDGECIARDCETDETDFCNYGKRRCEE